MSQSRQPLRVIQSALPFVFLLAVVFLVIQSNPTSSSRQKGTVSPVSGVLDLTGRTLPLYEVRGEWFFDWKELHADLASFTGDRFLVLPGSWLTTGETSRQGYASFGLKVSGLEPHTRYALRVGHSLTAVRVLVNGKEELRFGSPGTSYQTEIPAWDSGLARFTPLADGTAEIILQISNYRDRNGGTNATLYLGRDEVLTVMEDRQKLTEGLLFAILGIMAFFFLALFLSRRSDRLFLWFAGLCLVVAVRTLCYDGFTLNVLIPSLPWEALFKIGYLTFPCAIIFFIGFLHSLYPRLYHRVVFGISLFGMAAYALLILFAPIYLTTLLLAPVQFFALAVVLWGLVVIIVAVWRGEEGSLWFLAGFSAAVFSFTYDVLVSLWIISGFSLSQLGMSFCLFALALMVSQRYASALEKTVLITTQLKFINHSLQRFVPSQFLSCLGKASICDVQLGDSVELEMAVLSADIRSFTSIAEKMSPDEIFSFLNEYLELVGPIIRKQGGFIAKYLGDGFMALFPSGAEAAVLCGIKMQAAVTGRNRSAPEKKAISIGIGIDCGRIYLGTIGDPSRMDGTVLSSCVKSAEQLEQATKLYQSRIMINETVFSQLSDPSAYFIRPVDRVHAGNKGAFLFEVYNNDKDDLRDRKWKTQADLEHGLFAFFTRQHDEAAFFLSKVLTVFPEDPVARLYYERLRL